MAPSNQSYDVVIIGAGISGINAACRLQKLCPGRSYTILEGRKDMGGTWDLFKYPGIRSDSDLHTFGFPFRPWMDTNAIADGHHIVQYMKDTATEYDVNKHIHYQHKVEKADFSTREQRWNLTVNNNGNVKAVKCQFLLFCTGYYDYENPLDVKIPGISNFKGQIIHPQFWPDNLSLRGKNVVIIGSGATAVTLLPNLAKEAAHVTMLQRSPSWIVPMPQNDGVSRFIRRVLPRSWVPRALRWRFLFLYYMSYTLFQRWPALGRKVLRQRAKEALPKGYPMDPNFNPSYNPWDQRLCVCPDGDFFDAIRAGNADIVTGTIDNISEKSIHVVQPDAKKTLNPDVIITATGLKMQVAGRVAVSVDGTPRKPEDGFVYRHAMLSGIPNAFVFIGYVQYSWTLGSDVSARWACRLMNHMAERGFQSATPQLAGDVKETAILPLKSTYVQRGAHVLPHAGNRDPWLPRKSYMHDLWEATHSDFREMEFRKAGERYSDNGDEKSLLSSSS